MLDVNIDFDLVAEFYDVYVNCDFDHLLDTGEELPVQRRVSAQRADRHRYGPPGLWLPEWKGDSLHRIANAVSPHRAGPVG